MKHFSKSLFVTAILVAASVPASAFAADSFAVDPMHTQTVFTINHLGYSMITGNFHDIKGELLLDDKAPANSSVAVTIGTASVGVDNLGGAVEAYLSSHFSGFPNGVPPPGLYHRILKEIEVPLLTAALAATRGNQIRAADLLGLNRNTLRKKIRDLDIQVYRSGG